MANCERSVSQSGFEFGEDRTDLVAKHRQIIVDVLPHPWVVDRVIPVSNDVLKLDDLRMSTDPRNEVWRTATQSMPMISKLRSTDCRVSRWPMSSSNDISAVSPMM